MEFLIMIFGKMFTVSFFTAAVVQGMPLLYGALGELLTEKSGNLNLGIPGIMYMGAIGGLTGAYLYESGTTQPVGMIGILAAFGMSVLFSLFGGAIYAILTITFRSNQNVTGLALTVFGIGLGNFLGGSLSRLANTAGQVTVYTTGKAFKKEMPLLSQLGIPGKLVFSFGVLTYFALLLAVVIFLMLKYTRYGLNLRAVGENPQAADAAGINVIKYKYAATLMGAVIAGLGGLYFDMEYMGGTWQNNGFGDRGWLAVALVIFVLWKPLRSIWGAVVFGGLYVLSSYIPIGGAAQELFKMIPYVVTVIVLILTSIRRKKENQPPASLGLAYFREER